jgi:para-aminobenzoate synthetase / 4-amino-4-deoxychorismate lyase
MNPDAPKQVFENGTAIFRCADDAGRRAWIQFRNPLETAIASSVEEVAAALKTIDEAMRKGRFAAGYVAYEAAPALDPTCKTRPPAPFERRIKLSEWGIADAQAQQRPAALPIVWFGIYDKVVTLDPDEGPFPRDENPIRLRWENRMRPELFKLVVSRVRDYITRGECHRVRYLLRLRSAFEGNSGALFRNLQGSRRTPYGAYIGVPGFDILSSSPELLFGLSAEKLQARPVLASTPRALTWAEDVTRSEALKAGARSSPDIAATLEGVLKCLGRIAGKGSIASTSLFDIERSASTLYLNSMLEASTTATVGELIAALFPPASATGAPRQRAMEIVAELETAPRLVFAGCAGFAGPRSPLTGQEIRTAQFSMAHGLIVVDRANRTAELGAACTLTPSSDAATELAACVAQGEGIEAAPASFQLYESVLWQPERGYHLLDLHLQRLASSAMYFGYTFNVREVLSALTEITKKFCSNRHRVQVFLEESGRFTIQSEEAPPDPRAWNVALAREPVQSSNVYLYHQTTRREAHETARRARPDVDDAILWNERGEVTEATSGNILVRRENQVVTPPVACGLLAGTYRQHLLARKEVVEAVVKKEELASAEAIFLVNSLRDWVRVTLVP